MSTTHDLAIVGNPHGRGHSLDLSITEQGCLFSLDLAEQRGVGRTILSIDGLEPEEVRNIALRMIAAASYATEDPDEFMEETKDMVDYHYTNKLELVEKDG